MAIFKPFFSSPSFAAFVSPSAAAAVVVFSPAAAVVDFAAPDAPQPAKREATSTAPVRTFQVFFIMRSSPSKKCAYEELLSIFLLKSPLVQLCLILSIAGLFSLRYLRTDSIPALYSICDIQALYP